MPLGASAGPAEFATIWFAVGRLGEMAVASLGDTSDDRTDAIDDLFGNFAVRSDEASKGSGNFDV